MCIGCKRKAQLKPEALYDEIETQFVSGDLSDARKQSDEAYRQFESSRPEWAATFRIELAKILIYQGNNADALVLLQQPLPAGTGVKAVVRRGINLAIAQTRVGQLDQAEQTLLDVERQSPGGPLRAEIIGAQGSIDLDRGKLDDAERAFQTSLAGARRNGNTFLQMQALLNLGVVALQEEHYEDALVRFGDASAMARSINAKQALEKAVGNLGFVYYKTGDFQRSLANFSEAGKQAAEVGSPIDQVRSLNNAGLSEYRLGELNAARSFYEQSLGLAQSIQNQQEILDAHVNLGFLLLRLGDADAAGDHVREANRLAALMKNDRAGLEPALLDALLLKARGDRQGATKQLLSLEERAADVPSLQWEAESNLAHLYAETGQATEADHWFRRSIETFQRQRSSLTSVESTLPFLENGSDLYVGYMEHLIHEGRTEEALHVIDESRAESLEDGLRLSRQDTRHDSRREAGRASPEDLNARAIAARLHATILVYCLRPRSSYLWVITPTREQFHPIAGSETIASLIEQHTKMILASKDLLSQPDAPGRSLYDDLVEPATGLIKKGSKIYIVGDEALSGLNFETLQTPGQDSHYWIEDVTITNAKSLQLLSVEDPRASRSAEKRILLMGNPVYRNDEYAELPNAATEVADVASHFSPDRRTVFTGSEASPETYRRLRADQFSYIHFVAHATANMTSPLDSAVVLSSDPDNASAYKLYARDILKQRLQADLVTVSACYGSGLRKYSGEGLVGLAWAFLRAGSHHVIGAMWEVSDASTPLLMDHLYGELAKGSQPDAALRSAKLSMIRSKGVFRKPLYWAPFLLYAGA